MNSLSGPQFRGGVEGSGGGDGIPFFSIHCDQTVTGTTNCIPTCVFPGCFLSPPPPPSPAVGKPTQSHLAPFLIAGVSILGILFLLLTTCTIILRYQFSRRRTSPVISARSLADDDGDAIDHPIWLINTVGLQQSVIDSITAFKFSKLDGILIDGSDCSVCLTEFDDGDDLRLLPKCSHAFHVNCIDIWLRSHKNCPLCRAPVVKDSNFSLNLLGSGDLGRGEDDHLNNNDENNQMGLVLTGGGGESSIREGDDVLVDLPIEGVKLAEILQKNRELRILSDLGEYHRFRGENDGVDLVKRSISFNSSASLAIHRAMDDIYYLESEGSSSSNNRLLVDEKKIEFDNEKETKKGSSMSGLSMKSSSIGRTLQKGSVSMKRSISSSSKLFSFRRSKSQASILPLSIQISDAHNNVNPCYPLDVPVCRTAINEPIQCFKDRAAVWSRRALERVQTME